MVGWRLLIIVGVIDEVSHGVIARRQEENQEGEAEGWKGGLGQGFKEERRERAYVL